MIESIFQSKNFLNGFESLTDDLKQTKIYSDFIKIIHEFLEKFYDYFETYKKLKYQSKQENSNDRISVYVSSSNVIINSNDENNEIHQKLIEAKIPEKQKKNSINERKRISSIHITTEKSFSPKDVNAPNHRRFFSPTVKSETFKKQIINKETKDDTKIENPKVLQKNIKDLKSEISKLIWEEERRVI